MKRLVRQAQNAWNAHLAARAEILRAHVDHIAHDPAIIQAWRHRGLPPSLVSLAEPIAQRLNRKYDITHVYFIDPDRVCVLRGHAPTRHGDRIDRFTCLEAERSGKDAWGVELGPLGTFTLRYVAPWKRDGKLLGYLELGTEVEHLADALAEELDAAVATAICKEATSREKFEAGQQVFGFLGTWDEYPDFVMARQTMPSLPTEVKRRLEHGHHLHLENAVFEASEGARRFACAMMPLTDAAGRDAARLIVMRDVTADAKAAWRSWFGTQGLATLLVVLVLALLWSVTGKAEAQLAGAFAALRERIKELDCMQKVGAGLQDNPPLESVCKQIADALARAMQHPELAHVIVSLGKARYAHDPSAAEPVRGIHAGIHIGGDRFGYLAVDYPDGRAFLLEEQRLLDAVAGTVGDFLRRRRAEDQLRESKERLAATLRSIGEGVIAADAVGNITNLNTVAEALTGWSDAEACGRPIAEVFHVIDASSGQDLQAPLRRAGTDARSAALNEGTVLIARDGTERRIADSCAPVHDAAGKVIGTVLVFRDVTEEYRQRERLQESEGKYRALVENANDIIYSLTPEGVFTYVSPNWTRLVGHDISEVEGHHFQPFVHPEDQCACIEFLNKVLETGEPQSDVEYRVRHKNGQWRWHKSNASAVRNRGGQVSLYVGIARDVTDYKGMEESVRRANEELEQYVVALESANRALEEFNAKAEAANCAKSEFLANMSHEIRTPITAILGYADILIDENVGRATRENAVVIKRNGEHLLGLINDILDLSKVEAGKLEIERVRCSPAELVAEVVALMRVRTEAKHLKLLADLSEPLPETILTDPLRLRQVLVNLVGNAVKFTECGEIRLATRLIHDAGLPRLRLEVTDTGIGMSTKQMEEIFQPFSQVDSSAARRFGGTGLGLAISKRLAEALGGDIEVRSTVGKGSTFTVRIDPGPLDGIPMVCPELAPMHEPVTSSSPEGLERPVRLAARVLLAEDGPDNRRLIGFLLKKAGADVTFAENGRLAVEAALSARAGGASFDLILMDMQMPVMDGYAATRRLREEGYAGPIVALTAHAMAHDRQKCLDAGCNEYLSKPIDRQRLLALVGQWACAVGETAVP